MHREGYASIFVVKTQEISAFLCQYPKVPPPPAGFYLPLLVCSASHVLAPIMTESISGDIYL